MADVRDRRAAYEREKIDHGDYSSSKWYSVESEREKRDRPGLERRRTSDYDTGALVVRETIPRDDGSIYVRETVTYRDREEEIERDRRLPPAPAPPHWDDRPLNRPGGRASSRVRFASPPREWDHDRRDRDRELDTQVSIREHYRDVRRDEGVRDHRDWERERDPSDMEHDRRFMDSYTRIERSPYGRRESPRRRSGGDELIPYGRRESPPRGDAELVPFPRESRYAPDDFDRYERRERERYGGPPRDADAYDRYGNEALYRDRYARTAAASTEDTSSHYERVSEHEIVRRDDRYRRDQQHAETSRYFQERESNAGASARPSYHRSRSMSLPPQAKPPPLRKIQVVTAMRAYKGTHTGDLTLVEGDLVRVTGKHGRHWLIGKNVDTQAQGFFPKDFVEGYESEEEEVVDVDVREYRNEPSVAPSERSGGYGPTVMVSNIPHVSTLKSERVPETVVRTTTTYQRQPQQGYRSSEGKSSADRGKGR